MLAIISWCNDWRGKATTGVQRYGQVREITPCGVVFSDF